MRGYTGPIEHPRHTNQGPQKHKLLHNHSKESSESATPTPSLNLINVLVGTIQFVAWAKMDQNTLAIEHRRSVDTNDCPQLDHDSFADLFEQARGILRVVAASECGFDLADDIVQHAAVIALERIDQFTPGTNFNAWTSAIVRGVARNQRRSEQRHRSKIFRFTNMFPRNSSQQSDRLSNPPTTSKLVAPDLSLHEEFDDRLRAALDTLNTTQRTCFLLRTLLEHSYSEIGEILGIPAVTARSHVYRSRTALLDQLENFHPPMHPSSSSERGDR